MSDVFEGIIGHEAQTNYLRTILEKKSFSHAYCFAGPSGLGKLTIAKRFCASILNVMPENLEKHPDVIFLDLSFDEKKGELKSTIPVESIRELRGHLQLSSFFGGTRIAIIQHADKMTTAAQNALLKTLEEPRKGTLVILIAESLQRLLPTIRSRTVEIRFTRVSKEKIRELIPDRLVEFAAGRPGEAMRLRETEYQEQVLAEIEVIERLLGQPTSRQIGLVEKMIKDRERSEMKHVLGVWQSVLHSQFIAALKNQPSESIQLARRLNALGESAKAIDENVSVNLAFEHVIIH